MARYVEKHSTDFTPALLCLLHYRRAQGGHSHCQTAPEARGQVSTARQNCHLQAHRGYEQAPRQSQ